MDSAQCIDYEKSEELVVSDVGVHTKSSLATMQDTANKLNDFFVDSQSWGFISPRIKLLFPRTIMELKGQMITQMHMLL